MCPNVRHCQLRRDCYVHRLSHRIREPHSQHKPKTCNKHTKEKERNLNVTLQNVIKPQGKRERDERNCEELQEQPENNDQNGAKCALIDDYFTCKWTKFADQKSVADWAKRRQTQNKIHAAHKGLALEGYAHKIFHTKGHKQRASVALLTSGKID